MLSIDDLKKLAEMQVKLLKISTNDRDINLEKYIDIVKQIDEFYFSNMRRLTCAAYSHIRHNYSITSIASYEDLLQQVYIELRTGVIKLRPFDKAINGAVYRSFRYAPVGGNDTTFIYQDKERGQCQKAAN